MPRNPNRSEEPLTVSPSPQWKADFASIKPECLPVNLGRYRIQELIGEGGMARVFRAELQGPAGFRKEVALKLLKNREGRTTDSEKVLSLVREGCMAGRLRHPNIVDVYELGEIRGEIYLAMEFVRGANLARFVELNPRIPLTVLLEIFVGVADGLSKAHGLTAGIEQENQGLIHCDVKPSNILVSEEGEVKIGDFGIAIHRPEHRDFSLAEKQKIQGTPRYMSPEQVQGLPLQPGTDIFSFGVMLASLVLREDILGKRGVLGLLEEGGQLRAPLISRDQHQRLEAKVPGLGDLVLRCLNPDSSRRFPSALQLREALQDLQQVVGYRPRLKDWISQPSRAQRLASMEASHFQEPHPPATTENLERFSLNFDVPPSEFVGRVAERKALKQSLDSSCRLLTIKGMGGVGKTRLAKHFALEVRRSFAGGVRFVELSETTTLSGFLQQVAAALALSLPQSGQPRDLAEHLGEQLVDRPRTLLLLDNVEQLVKEVAPTLHIWLGKAPLLSLLLTSRQPLGLAEERVVEIRPLRGEEGVRLLLSHVPSGASGWGGRVVGDPVLREIVEKLDGVPLALELAAARGNLLSPELLLQRLEERFKILRSRRRDVDERQGTLKKLIDWSWNLLEPWEQSAFLQLAAFSEGFYMEAAEAVLDLSDFVEAPWAVDAVEALLEKSLLEVVEQAGRPRFSMVSSIHAYAQAQWENLEDSATWKEALFLRHAEHFGSAYSQFESALWSVGERRNKNWHLLQPDLGNFRLGVERGGAVDSAKCALCILQILVVTGPLQEGLVVLSRVRDPGSLPRYLSYKLRIHRSRLYRLSGRSEEALKELDFGETKERVDYAQERSIEVQRLWELATTEVERGSPETAMPHFLEAISLSRELGDKEWEAIALGSLAIAYQDAGDNTNAIENYRASLTLHQELSNLSGQATTLGNLGTLFHAHGDLELGLEYLERSLKIHQQLGNRVSAGIVCSNIGALYSSRGLYVEAERFLSDAIEIQREVGIPRFEGAAIGNLGDLHLSKGEMALAESHLREAIAICDESFVNAAGAFRGSLALLLAKREQFQEAIEVLTVGSTQVFNEPYERCKFLLKQGIVEVLAGMREEGLKSLSRARQSMEDLENVPLAELRLLYDELLHMLDRPA